MHQYNVGAPFEMIAFAIAGPFSESDRENRYFLISVDCLTKWTEIYAIAIQEASTLTDAMFDQVLKLRLPDGAAQRPGPVIRIQANAGDPVETGGQQN
jgi:class 3 adenylate cyclase